MHFTDHPLLSMIFNETQVPEKNKNEKTLDDIFYEYINYIKDKTNKNYFILCLKFIILFRECMNISRKNQIANPEEEQNILSTTQTSILKKEYSSVSNAETAPDLCNEFVTEFLELNDYFGIKSDQERNEIIELIQHFCLWLYLNGYTQSRLSRLS